MYKIFEKIKTLLFKPKVSKLISSKNYTYKNIDNYDTMHFIHKDIVEYNKALKTILEYDLIKLTMDRNIIIPHTNEVTTLKHWCTDNDRMLPNINSEIIKWCRQSEELREIYTSLCRLRKGDTIISFNIRKIQPYIINIEQIVEKLIKHNKE